jgi:hypothetical protein
MAQSSNDSSRSCAWTSCSQATLGWDPWQQLQYPAITKHQHILSKTPRPVPFACDFFQTIEISRVYFLCARFFNRQKHLSLGFSSLCTCLLAICKTLSHFNKLTRFKSSYRRKKKINRHKTWDGNSTAATNRAS